MQNRIQNTRTGVISVTLALVIALHAAIAQAQGKKESNSTIKRETIEKDGLKLEMSFTTPDGKAMQLAEGITPIIKKQTTVGKPNQFELRFEAPYGNNLFTRGSEGKEERPTTMRQIRIGDYKTDGVLLAGDMWQSMDKWGVAGMLGSIELATFDPKQSLKSFAKANKIAASDLELLNPLVDFSKIRRKTPVCINATHRALPGESIAFIADLHQTDVRTLTKLNNFDNEKPITWQKLRVPAVTEKSTSGFAFYTVKYAPNNRKPSIDRQSLEIQQHRVLEGENLTSIGKKYKVSARELAWMNRVSPESKPMVGQSLTVRSEIRLAREFKLPHLVDELETVWNVQLESFLQANELQSPSDLRPGQKLQIPTQTKR